MNKNIICNNCFKPGHQLHNCKLPIISYGVIAFRKNNNNFEYLMIQRSNSFGYIDFIRGKYHINDLEHLQDMIDEMSIEEKNKIITNDFEFLWKQMWLIDCETTQKYSYEEYISQKKFELLKNGVLIENELITLESLVKKSKTNWLTPEWEFPKGRKNNNERDINCALREFEEETGIPKNELIVADNVIPFEEMFLGSNHKAYKHIFFLAYIDKINNDVSNYQIGEVSKIEWKTIDGCLEKIRPYNLEKKRLIKNINNILQEYRLY